MRSSWVVPNRGKLVLSMRDRNSPLAHSYLLPTGDAALPVLQERLANYSQPNSTFKWKIGVTSIETELEIFHQLIQILPKDAKLRLDANGGLSVPEAKRWLEECDRISSIEFLEQPLAVDRLEEMLALESQYSTAIALDESVANFAQLEAGYRRGWRGIFVIKPGILGSPTQLRKFCQSHSLDLVFSSVFETEIGRYASLQIAAELQHSDRAAGFGVGD